MITVCVTKVLNNSRGRYERSEVFSARYERLEVFPYPLRKSWMIPVCVTKGLKYSLASYEKPEWFPCVLQKACSIPKCVTKGLKYSHVRYDRHEWFPCALSRPGVTAGEKVATFLLFASPVKWKINWWLLIAKQISLADLTSSSIFDELNKSRKYWNDCVLVGIFKLLSRLHAGKNIYV